MWSNHHHLPSCHATYRHVLSLFNPFISFKRLLVRSVLRSHTSRATADAPREVLAPTGGAGRSDSGGARYGPAA